jgi:4-diphosphocytidyl-2C-methyl-D-erythritol kinase
VVGKYTEVRDVRDALRTHDPVVAMLSGSGASVFALFAEEAAAEGARAAVEPSCRWAVTTRFLNRMPGL